MAQVLRGTGQVMQRSHGAMLTHSGGTDGARVPNLPLFDTRVVASRMDSDAEAEPRRRRWVRMRDNGAQDSPAWSVAAMRTTGGSPVRSSAGTATDETDHEYSASPADLLV